MKPSQLREKSDSELIEQERELREELFNLRFQHSTGQLENTMATVRVKKDIARVKTVLRERVVGGEGKTEGSDVPTDR
jgi:large subunit ribosomal protein L29